MRNIVNISLPSEMNTLVKKAVKSGRYASTSEFFRDLLRMWADDQFTDALAQSEKEFRFGKGRKLRSLKDLR